MTVSRSRFFSDLDAAHPEMGGKARGLARLAAAGYGTPPGFVVTDAIFRALLPDGESLPMRLDQRTLHALDDAAAALSAAPWPAGFLKELDLRLANIVTSSFSVRSSFRGEDDADGFAPGVYESCIDIPAAHVPAAIRKVLCSAVSPAAGT